MSLSATPRNFNIQWCQRVHSPGKGSPKINSNNQPVVDGWLFPHWLPDGSMDGLGRAGRGIIGEVGRSRCLRWLSTTSFGPVRQIEVQPALCVSIHCSPLLEITTGEWTNECKPGDASEALSRCRCRPSLDASQPSAGRSECRLNVAQQAIHTIQYLRMFKMIREDKGMSRKGQYLVQQ
jgi:hypothetical protein